MILGTTGKPKGVDVTHNNVANLVCQYPGNLGVSPGDRVGQVLNISFDMGKPFYRKKSLNFNFKKSNTLLYSGLGDFHVFVQWWNSCYKRLQVGAHYQSGQEQSQ